MNTDDTPDIVVVVPGSSANIGPGFDTLCVALNLFLRVRVWINKERTICSNIEDIEIKWKSNVRDSDEKMENPKENLIVLSAVYLSGRAGKKIPQIKLECVTDIPLEKGMGSSGAAIVAGICIANELCHLGLEKEELLEYAILVEGFADNVTASFFGGFTISPKMTPQIIECLKGTSEYLKAIRKSGEYTSIFKYCPEIKSNKHLQILKLKGHRNMKFITLVPSCNVSTSEARAILPKTYNREILVDSLNNIARIVCCFNSDEPLCNLHTHIQQALKDKIHHPHRAKLVAGLSKLLDIDFSDDKNIIGLYISGSGPTVQVLTYDNIDVEFVRKRIAERWINFAREEGSDLSVNVFNSTINHRGAELSFKK